MHERQADSWTYLKGKHAQDLGTTSLYPANTEHGEVVGLEDQRAWFGGGERGKIYFYGSKDAQRDIRAHK